MKTMNKTEKACFYFKGISFDNAQELFVTNISTCILNVLFGVVTFVANSSILLAIKKKNRDPHSPFFVLLGRLAASDLLVGLICQPLFVASKIAELQTSFTTLDVRWNCQKVCLPITQTMQLKTVEKTIVGYFQNLIVQDGPPTNCWQFNYCKTFCDRHAYDRSYRKIPKISPFLYNPLQI